MYNKRPIKNYEKVINDIMDEFDGKFTVWDVQRKLYRNYGVTPVQKFVQKHIDKITKGS